MDRILFIGASVLFWGYVLICLSIFGIPSSLSNTFYLIKEKSGGKFKPYFFTLILWATAFLLMGPWIERVNHQNLECLPFLGCAALCFVGAAPHFKEKSEKLIHSYSAAMSAVAAYSYALIDQHEYIITAFWTVLFVAFAFGRWECKTFFVEMGTFAIIFHLLFKSIF